MKTSIVWLRQDLRLTDNPALYHAAQRAERVIPVYIHAPDEAAPWTPGSAANWWRHHSLVALQDSIERLGGRLVVRRGDSLTALRALIRESDAEAVYWNALYEPQLAKQDRHIATQLRRENIEVHEYDGNLIYPPGSVLNKEQKPYRVFTAFWRTCRQLGLGDPPLPAPKRLAKCMLRSDAISSLGLLPREHWYEGLAATWQPGENSALERLQQFCTDALEHYNSGRDIPAQADTSRLSPHLACGEISPRQIVNVVLESFTDRAARGDSVDLFLSELGWREFAYHCLHHFPYMSDEPLNSRFQRFPWRRDTKLLRAWQQGRTGIPIIDAGMRELWRNGWMHNRVRMVVASFLTKNGLQPWQTGAKWFWDTLVDADLASNSFNWQWVAGCGLDAAPYFRIFNPVRQSERFDPRGEYVRRWLPELAELPLRWLHTPWLAPLEIQDACKVRIGIDYPAPILDLSGSRQRALKLAKQLPAVAK